MRYHVDIERLGVMAGDIERYLSDVEELLGRGERWRTDKWEFYATSMLLFSLINRVLDLGGELVMELKLGIPHHYRDIFAILARNGMIGPDLADDLGRLVYYRNLLSHEYQRVTEEDIGAILGQVGGIDRFLTAVRMISREEGMQVKVGPLSGREVLQKR
jgi:uncharacterized protein YutE (UPF0331/DUF86 family)